jgi:hypothetical protein
MSGFIEYFSKKNNIECFLLYETFFKNKFFFINSRNFLAYSNNKIKTEKTTLEEELKELTDNKLKNSILIKKRKMNIEVITKLIALYVNINKVCNEMKEDDSLKPLTTEFESANEYSKNIIKFIKEIRKENDNNNEHNIVSLFKNNNLCYLLLNKEQTVNKKQNGNEGKTVNKGKLENEGKTVNEGKSTNGKQTVNKEQSTNNVSIDFKKLLSLKLFFPKSKTLIKINKDEKPFFNEDFIEEITKYILGNNMFIDFLKLSNSNFKDIITKLLKENRKGTTFKYLIDSIDTKTNIQKLNSIISKCINDEKTYKNNNENIKTKIYPYTNFIIAYFAIYLIIINLILQKLNNSNSNSNSNSNNENNNTSVLSMRKKEKVKVKVKNNNFNNSS